jgi:signal peptide peptidase SppA
MGSKRNHFDHLIGFAVSNPWAITPEMLSVIEGILTRRLAGEDTTVDVQALGRREVPTVQKGAGVALIPMHGVIAPRMNMFTEISGGTTFEQATQNLREAVDAKDIGTIVLDWDSPGGNAFGASDFAREILKARAVKPVISQVNHMMCSAAYWTGACATEIVATCDAMVGSIGVYTMHDDLSGAREQRGIKRELLSVGKFKVEGHDNGPLTEDARAHVNALLEKTMARMCADIAKGRGISAAAVRSQYGEGRVVSADDALAAGMIDRIATLDDTLSRALAPASGTSLTARAEAAAADGSQTPLEAADTQRLPDRTWKTDIERQLLALTL